LPESDYYLYHSDLYRSINICSLPEGILFECPQAFFIFSHSGVRFSPPFEDGRHEGRTTKNRGDDMKLRHRIRINVTDSSGRRTKVVSSGVRHLPMKLLTALFGENTEVLILSPGQSVQSVEIHEMKGGETNDSGRTA
jgi:hypothetical protein